MEYDLGYTDSALAISLYTAQDQSAGVWLGFLIAGLSSPPTSISFSDSFSESNYANQASNGLNGGIYLLADEAPSDAADFLGRMQTWLTELNQESGGQAYRYHLWIDDPDAATLSGSALPFDDGDGNQSYSVPADSYLGFQPYQLYFPAQSSVTLDSGGQGLNFSQVGFMQDQSTTIGSIGQALLLISASGRARNLAFDWTLSLRNGNGSTTDWEILDPGLSYFYQGEDQVYQQRYPVLILPQDSDTSSLVLACSLDPLHPEESRMGFDMVEEGPWTSGFTTAQGNAVLLSPTGEESQLCFARGMGENSSGEVETIYYLSFEGAFDISFAQTESTAIVHLLPGLSVTESLGVNQGENLNQVCQLVFTPGQAAFAEVFPLAENAEIPSELLNDTCTTSWATLQSNQANLYYYSAPEEGALYAQTGTEVSDFLGYVPLPVTELPDELPLPMAGYRGIVLGSGINTFPEDLVADFEYQILNPSRSSVLIAEANDTSRDLLMEAGLPESLLNEDGELVAATKAGVLVQIDGSNAWSKILLGTNTVITDTGSGSATRSYDLQFLNPTDPLKTAFMSNQQFLVISDPTNLGEQGGSGSIPDAGQAIFNNLISIAGWPFKVEVGSGSVGNYENVILFKFGEGSIAEGVTNPSLWTQAASFNVTENNGLGMLSYWLENYIADAQQKYREGGNTYYRRFVEIVEDPDWNGILVFRPSLELSELPLEIKAVLGGVDLTVFQGHHFGIELNHVSKDLSMEEDSSLFGLVDYWDSLYLSTVVEGDEELPLSYTVGSQDYAFRVLKILVSLNNSEIVDFESLAQLTMLSFFGDRIDFSESNPEYVENNSIVLNGVMSEQDGLVSYSFASDDSLRVYGVQSNVFQAIGIRQVLLGGAAIGSNGTELASEQTVFTTFQLVGILNFKALSGYDIFSFGTEADSSSGIGDEGLGFSGMSIEMSFDYRTAAVANFEFNVRNLDFDLRLSSYRSGSLFMNFPIQLNGLLSGASERPEDLGYTALDTGLTALDLDDQWYALQYEVDLGTPGALAAKAGFKAQMITAWSPYSSAQSSPSIQVFLSLPGGGSGIGFFELQGVIKIKADTASLVLSSDDSPSWMLRLNGIVIQILIAKLPPQGRVDFYLFGDPTAEAKSTNLGWYLAYNQASSLSLSSGEMPTLKP